MRPDKRSDQQPVTSVPQAAPGGVLGARWTLWFAIVAVVVLALAAVLYRLTHRSGRFVVQTVENVVRNVTPPGWSSDLVTAIVIVVTIPFFWAVANYTDNFVRFWRARPSLKLYRNRYGIIMVFYAAAFFFARHLASTERWCGRTPQGLQGFDGPGVDPVFHVPLHPCTHDELIELVEHTNPSLGPKEIQITSLDELNRFEPFSRNRPGAKVYYCRLPDGSYELYDNEGTCPRTQEPLKPLDPENWKLIDRWFLDRFEAERVRKNLEAGEAAKTARESHRIEEEKLRRAYISRYVIRPVEHAAGPPEWAVLIVDERGETSPTLTQIARDALARKGWKGVSIFREAVFSDHLYDELFRGDRELITKLDLRGVCDGLLLGKLLTKAAEDPVVQGLISERVSFHVRLISARSGQVQSETRLEGRGGGFSVETAESQAVGRLGEAFREWLQGQP